ncbi:MAG: ROK family protein [Cryobacterium sp.]|nr:ROK family protein [Cryobacterium sp.]
MPGRLALALDLGGTKVESALIDEAGRNIPGSRFRRPTGPARTSAELESQVRAVVGDALAALPAGAKLAGVGIGAAGPIDQDRGLVSPLNLPAWRDFPLVELVGACVPNTTVTLRMDGLCITLAEHWLGAARGVSNLLGMVVSTGIGGGLILGGRAAPGGSGNAGHIGHLEISGFSEPCACGGTGCLEAVASGPRTVAWAREQGWIGSSGEELAQSYASGDRIARAAVERAGLAIGRAIGSATSLTDLDLVVIGGGFASVTPDLFEFIERGIDAHSTFGFVRRVVIAASALSGDGPLVGAASLIHEARLLD